MPDRHEVDGGEQLQPGKPVVAQQRGLPLVVVHAEPGLGVEGEVGVHERLPEVVQPAQRLSAERRGLSAEGCEIDAPRRTGDFREQRLARLLHPPHPLVGGREHRFRRGEERGGGAQLRSEGPEGLDPGEGVEPGSMAVHLLRLVAEVLEAAGRGEDLEGFEEGLRPLHRRSQRRGSLLVDQAPAPERDAALEGLMGDRQPPGETGDRLLELPDRLVLAFGDQVRHARGQPEQREQRLEGRQVPFPGPLDVPEPDELVERRGGERGQAGGVELAPGNGEHEVAGMDQRREQDHGPFGFEAQGLRGQVLDPKPLLDELGTVHDLALPLRAHPFEDVGGVLRPGGIEPVAVEEIERVEDRGGLPRLRRARDPAQRILGRLGAVPGRDRHREARIVRRLVGEMRLQADARHRVDQIAQVDAFRRGDPRKLAEGMAPGPFRQRLPAAPVDDLEGRRHVFLEPANQIAEEARRLRLVGGLRVAGGGRSQIQGRGIAAQGVPEARVRAAQVEEDLVRLLLVPEVGRVVGRDEVEVEVARRHRRGPLVRRPEEQVSPARGPARAPFELVLPDPVAGHVGLVGALHHPPQGVVVVAVQPRRIQALGPLLDQGVEIVGLPEVEVVLAVVRVGRDELAAHRAVDLPEHRLHLRQEVVGGVPPEVFDPRLVQAEAVPELFRGGAQAGVDVAGGQPVHRQGMDDAQRHRLVGRPRIRLLDARFEHLAAIDDRLHVGDRAEGGVLPQHGPVAVVGDEAGAVRRELLLQPPLHRARQGAEDLALLHRGHPLEGVDVVGMDREQVHVLVHALVHAPVEAGERGQVFPDLRLLLAALAQQASGHDELHVPPGDADLLEAVLHPADAVGDEGEAGAVEDGLLHAGDEAEAEVLADLADLAQEVEVEDQLLVLARAQEIQQLVHHQQQPVIGVDRVERGHHLLEGALAAGGFGGAREGERDAERREMLLQLAGHDVVQGHGGRADLGAHHLEAAGDAARRLCRPRVRELGGQPGVFGDCGDHRHQVRLAGAVVADHQQPLVVGGRVVPELREDEIRQRLGHRVGDHVAAHEAAGGVRFVGVAKLHHAFDGVEPDQIFVLHRGALHAGPGPEPVMLPPPFEPPVCRSADSVGTRDARGWRNGRGRLRGTRSRPRPRPCSARGPAAGGAGAVAARHRTGFRGCPAGRRRSRVRRRSGREGAGPGAGVAARPDRASGARAPG